MCRLVGNQPFLHGGASTNEQIENDMCYEVRRIYLNKWIKVIDKDDKGP
jgi:hypothetical protein